MAIFRGTGPLWSPILGVLVNGRVTLDCPSAELVEREDIARSYLGL